MDLPITYTLQRPFEFEGTGYSVLSIDELDLDGEIAHAELQSALDGNADMSQGEKNARLTRFYIARMAEIPDAVAGKIRGTDVAELQVVISSIFKSIASDGGEGQSGNVTPAS